MRATLHNRPIHDNENLIRFPDSGQPVGDYHRCATTQSLV